MINVLIERNIKSLSQVAKRITPKQSHDLITDTYLKIIERSVPTNDHEFIKYFSKCMANNFNNQRSSFNKNFVIKEINYNFIEEDNSEDINKQDVYNELMEFKETLNTHEQILFELHYEQGMSCRDIAKSLRYNNYITSYRSIVRLINPINKKLKLKKWKSLNSWAFYASRGYSLRDLNRRNTSSLF